MFSLRQAFRRVGMEVRVTRNADMVRKARCLVLPGVASFPSVLQGIAGVQRQILEAVDEGVPLLGICAGMQVLFESSDEGSGEGLGLLKGRVRSLRAGIVPHIGWSPIKTNRDPWLRGLPQEAMVYYAHSYAASPTAPCVVATSNHDGPFAAAIHRENVFGVQFHPEKSGSVGTAILRNFLVEAEVVSSP